MRRNVTLLAALALIIAGASQWTPEAFSLWEVGVYLD